MIRFAVSQREEKEISQAGFRQHQIGSEIRSSVRVSIHIYICMLILCVFFVLVLINLFRIDAFGIRIAVTDGEREKNRQHMHPEEFESKFSTLRDYEQFQLFRGRSQV